MAGTGRGGGCRALVAGGWAGGLAAMVVGGKASCHPPRLRAPLASKTSASAPFSAPPSSAASAAAVTTHGACGGASALRGAAPVAMSDLQQFVAALPASDNAAWQTLASAWGPAWPTVPMPAPPCRATACVVTATARAGLNLVRQIDRPVLLTLFPSKRAMWRCRPCCAVWTATWLRSKARAARCVCRWPSWRRCGVATWPRCGARRPTCPTRATWRRPRFKRRLAGPATGDGWGARAGAPAAGRAATPAQRQARIQRFQLAQGDPGRPGGAFDPHAAQPCQRRERTALAHRRLVSYIPDALRAEAERGRGAVPGIHTPGARAGALPVAGRSAISPVLVAVAVVAVAAVAAGGTWWVW